MSLALVSVLLQMSVLASAGRRPRHEASGLVIQFSVMSTAKPVHAPSLPKPVGPYSPGVAFERLIFVSGQGSTDPATGKLAGEDTETQTEQCLRNVETILRAAGSTCSTRLRCGVFLLDMRDFDKMNARYSRVFDRTGRRGRRSRPPPCRASASEWRSTASRTCLSWGES